MFAHAQGPNPGKKFHFQLSPLVGTPHHPEWADQMLTSLANSKIGSAPTDLENLGVYMIALHVMIKLL